MVNANYRLLYYLCLLNVYIGVHTFTYTQRNTVYLYLLDSACLLITSKCYLASLSQNLGPSQEADAGSKS